MQAVGEPSWCCRTCGNLTITDVEWQPLLGLISAGVPLLDNGLEAASGADDGDTQASGQVPHAGCLGPGPTPIKVGPAYMCWRRAPGDLRHPALAAQLDQIQSSSLQNRCRESGSGSLTMDASPNDTQGGLDVHATGPMRFSAAAKGPENDAAIGATALEQEENCLAAGSNRGNLLRRRAAPGWPGQLHRRSSPPIGVSDAVNHAAAPKVRNETLEDVRVNSSVRGAWPVL
jgi:hypothetical protein